MVAIVCVLSVQVIAGVAGMGVGVLLIAEDVLYPSFNFFEDAIHGRFISNYVLHKGGGGKGGRLRGSGAIEISLFQKRILFKRREAQEKVNEALA